MSSFRFTILVVCGVLSVAALATPLWLCWWYGGLRKQRPDFVIDKNYRVLERKWDKSGWSSPTEASQKAPCVKGTLKLFKSIVTREPVGGVPDVMFFAEITFTNETDKQVTLSSAKIIGFALGMKMFEIPLGQGKDSTLEAKETIVLRSEGIFLPQRLVYDSFDGFVMIN